MIIEEDIFNHYPSHIIIKASYFCKIALWVQEETDCIAFGEVKATSDVLVVLIAIVKIADDIITTIMNNDHSEQPQQCNVITSPLQKFQCIG